MLAISMVFACAIQTNTHRNPKFFHEAAHGMDLRFSRGDMTLHAKHQALRQLLADATLIDVQWVVVFGSLLGWLHTGDVLPWDDDMDLALFLDGDVSTLRAANGQLINNTYIEVNPFLHERSQADVDNQIDARAISLDTGVYIDITFPTRYGSQYKTKSGRTMRVSDIVPARASVFAGSHVHVPRNPFGFLQRNYGCVHATAVKPVEAIRGQC